MQPNSSVKTAAPVTNVTAAIAATQSHPIAASVVAVGSPVFSGGADAKSPLSKVDLNALFSESASLSQNDIGEKELNFIAKVEAALHSKCQPAAEIRRLMDQHLKGYIHQFLEDLLPKRNDNESAAPPSTAPTPTPVATPIADIKNNDPVVAIHDAKDAGGLCVAFKQVDLKKIANENDRNKIIESVVSKVRQLMPEPERRAAFIHMLMSSFTGHPHYPVVQNIIGRLRILTSTLEDIRTQATVVTFCKTFKAALQEIDKNDHPELEKCFRERVQIQAANILKNPKGSATKNEMKRVMTRFVSQFPEHDPHRAVITQCFSDAKKLLTNAAAAAPVPASTTIVIPGVAPSLRR